MALDHALADLLPRGEAVLRLYLWEKPTISLGRHEPAAKVYRRDYARALGCAFVRRPTGGRAVLHDRELTYAAVVPLRSFGGARAAYSEMNKALREALVALGARVEVAQGEGAGIRPSAGPCFAKATRGEIVAAGRKLVGSAQVRVGDALLQHGSILLDGDQEALARLRRRPAGCGDSRAEMSGASQRAVRHATLKGLVGESSHGPVREAVVRSFRAALGGVWQAAGYSRAETVRAAELEKERYGADAWTWRS